jgi:hypothetical protein
MQATDLHNCYQRQPLRAVLYVIPTIKLQKNQKGMHESSVTNGKGQLKIKYMRTRSIPVVDG